MVCRSADQAKLMEEELGDGWRCRAVGAAMIGEHFSLIVLTCPCPDDWFRTSVLARRLNKQVRVVYLYDGGG